MAVFSTVKRLWQRPRYRRLVQLIWMASIAVFVGAAVYQNWHVIESVPKTWDTAALLGVALVAALLRRLAGALRWAWVVMLCGDEASRVSMGTSLRVYFVANLATYLPGTYWFIPGRMVLNRRHGMDAIQTGIGVLMEQLLLVLSGALVAVMVLDVLVEGIGYSSSVLPWMTAAIVLGLIAIHPRCFQWLICQMGRVMRIEAKPMSLSYAKLMLLLLWSIVIWVLGSVSLLYVARIFAPTFGLDHLTEFAGIFSVSWLTGFFTPFAPGGIGVREGVMGLALSAMGLPIALGVVIAMVSRLVIVFEDLVWAAISVAVFRHE